GASRPGRGEFSFPGGRRRFGSPRSAEPRRNRRADRATRARWLMPLKAPRFKTPVVDGRTAAALEAASTNFIPMKRGYTETKAIVALQQALIDFDHQEAIKAGDPRGDGQTGMYNPTGGANGVYDEETIRCVTNFQIKFHLQVDGEVGKQTLGKLDDLFS